MRSEAKLCLFGYVGQDPKNPSEKNPDFITFSFAVTTSWKDKEGEKQEYTDWYEIVTSQKGLSGIVSNYVKKGEPLYLEGTPKYGVYTSKDGEVKPKINVNLTKIVLLDQGKSDEGNGQNIAPQSTHVNSSVSSKGTTQQTRIMAGSGSMKDSLDDEIPF
jgi:single-strand DNA-binding protein